MNSFTFDIPEVVGLGVDRRPQAAEKAWPEGTVIVDPDAHWLEGDLWVDRFPEHLKHRAPRVRFLGDAWEFVVNGEQMFTEPQSKAICQQMECIKGMNDVQARIADMDVEGVDKQLMFPQRLLGLFFAKGAAIELRDHIFRAYNEYMAEICAQAPGRLYFVGIPNYWDVTQARTSIQEAKALGARALMVPINPQKDADGQTISYNNPRMDPFWAAVEESGLPLCFHIGENFPDDLPGSAATYVFNNFGGFRKSWGTLTYSGVFDRHPNLRVVFVEAGIAWVASMLHDADMVYAAFPPSGDNTFGHFDEDIAKRQVLAHKPSWYWSNHCYATFMTDPVGLQLLDRIGADRVMWAADYPHSEGTLGYTRTAVQAVFDATSLENAQKILGKTAIDVFNLR